MINAINRQPQMQPGDMTGQVKPQNLEQASEQFEALFLRSMLKEMRKASDVIGQDNPFNSKQQRMMRDFYDDKLAGQLASQRSTGIAQMIVSQLSPQAVAPLKNDDGMAALHQHPRNLKATVLSVLRQGQEK
ncbi:rod-binding protein [Citrobacter portucalensis]|uniref:rod-binding protein n=1 Tax=Citrobacter portucalensis TaxID=1639133 RepID=UPI003CEE0571